jgi:putative transposase
MSFDGASYRDIQNRFEEQFGYRPSTATLYEWVVEYSAKARRLLDRFKANTGDTWVADETVIKVDGSKLWLWDVVDVKTRYLLATHLSKTRTINHAETLFQQSKRRATIPPKRIITDKLAAYIDGIERAFGSETRHIQAEGIRSKELNNNLCERMQGTIKERTKVMRGMEAPNTARIFLDAFTLHYNHMRDHDSLGTTPARAAKLGLGFDNWIQVASLRNEQIPSIEQGKLVGVNPFRTLIFKARGL